MVFSGELVQVLLQDADGQVERAEGPTSKPLVAICAASASLDHFRTRLELALQFLELGGVGGGGEFERFGLYRPSQAHPQTQARNTICLSLGVMCGPRRWPTP